MLQYILTQNARYSVAELAQMAIEGGCTWISLHLPDMSDDEIKEAIVPDVMEMCRRDGIFLTVDDRPDLARELGMHGVRLSREYMIQHPDATPMSLREELGPEAVIGIETADASVAPQMRSADIDFITAPATLDSAARLSYINNVRASGCMIPVVAEGDFDLDELRPLLKAGFNGVAIGRMITDAEDPVTAVGQYLDILSQGE